MSNNLAPGVKAERSKILIADDEETLLTMLSKELVYQGYEVCTAVDGEDAISMLQRNSFDLILLDIKMPRRNGFEVLKVIKERYPMTKVVMLTGFGDLKNAIESRKLGADNFIAKPYDLVDLLSTVERLLN